MIFEALNAAADAGELLLVDGGLCHFHRRRDGQVTIREIIVLPPHRRQGIGRRLVEQASGDAQLVLARCPADLPANAFWFALGFTMRRRIAREGSRPINEWVKQ